MTSRATGATVPVWDRPVRLLHWTLVASVVLGWFTTEWRTGWHQPVGYAGLAALVLRLLWGCVGSRHARFAQFVRGPRATLAYARALSARRAPRHLGHNPLGGWMIVALLGCIAGLALTGWLYTTDWLWGDETVETVHRALAWGLLGLVALHVAGVLFTGRRQRENLVAAMFSGRKRAPAGDDVS
ncbi:cytochrome b/b6 domain-containing protein [Aquabacterium sp.]|uniref:cytochrome b/b6 domain-containing protein n=1 Tax=Aquabacterium sp. TaxID=1872578 RepID=UPI003784FCE6